MTLSEVTEPDTSSHNPVWHPLLLPWQILNCRLCKIRARDQVCSPLVAPSSGSLRHSTQDTGNPRTDSAQPATSARCLQILQGRRFATSCTENTQRFWNGLSLTNATDSFLLSFVFFFFLIYVVSNILLHLSARSWNCSGKLRFFDNCVIISASCPHFDRMLRRFWVHSVGREKESFIEELELDHSQFRTYCRMLSGRVEARRWISS